MTEQVVSVGGFSFVDSLLAPEYLGGVWTGLIGMSTQLNVTASFPAPEALAQLVSPLFATFPSELLGQLRNDWVNQHAPRYLPQCVLRYTPPAGWWVLRSFVDVGQYWAVITDQEPHFSLDGDGLQLDPAFAPPWRGGLQPQVTTSPKPCSSPGTLDLHINYGRSGLSPKAIRWGRFSEWVTDPVTGIKYPAYFQDGDGSRNPGALPDGDYVVSAPFAAPVVVRVAPCTATRIKIDLDNGDPGPFLDSGGASNWKLKGPRATTRRGLSGSEDKQVRRRDGAGGGPQVVTL